MKGVFETRAESGYDDELAVRYHFPNKVYLPIAHRLVGEWVVFREPKRERGRQAYIGVARVTRVSPDAADPSHSYAYVADYLPFDQVVPLKFGGRYAEALIRDVPSHRVGATLQGKSVREISETDFAEIVREGLSETFDPDNAIRLELDPRHADPATLDLVSAVHGAQVRRIEQILVNRKIREASFRLKICRAYDDTCAVTGMRIVNGGGKAEVQAAHIWPVSDGGPDLVQNGIALSGTVHWLFDRHLISITDDYRLLVSHNKVPENLRGLFRRHDQKIGLPADERLWPSRAFLEKHRDAYMAK